MNANIYASQLSVIVTPAVLVTEESPPRRVLDKTDLPVLKVPMRVVDVVDVAVPATLTDTAEPLEGKISNIPHFVSVG